MCDPQWHVRPIVCFGIIIQAGGRGEFLANLQSQCEYAASTRGWVVCSVQLRLSPRFISH